MIVRRRFTLGRIGGVTALGVLCGTGAALIGGLISMASDSGFSLLFDGLLYTVLAGLYGAPLCLAGVVAVGWPTIALLNAAGRCSRRAVVFTAGLVGLIVFILFPLGGVFAPLGCLGAGAGMALGLAPTSPIPLDTGPLDSDAQDA